MVPRTVKLYRTNTVVVIIDDSTCGSPWQEDTGTGSDTTNSFQVTVPQCPSLDEGPKYSVWIIDLVRDIVERKQRFLKPIPVLSKSVRSRPLSSLCRWLK